MDVINGFINVVKVIDYNYKPDLNETFLMQVLATIGPTCVDVYSSGGNGGRVFIKLLVVLASTRSVYLFYVIHGELIGVS